MIPLKEMEPLLARLMQFDALAKTQVRAEAKTPAKPPSKTPSKAAAKT
jgi:hypothetical protein